MNDLILEVEGIVERIIGKKRDKKLRMVGKWY